MQNVNVPENIPDFNEPPYRGSFQQLLSQNLGRRVRIDFMVGSNALSSVCGIVHAVGTQYVLIHQANDEIVAGEMFAVKKITFL